MSLRCELTAKGPIVKNLVSHSHHKTKKWMKPNVHRRRLYSDALGAYVSLRVATSTVRSIEHVGGFDKFILRLADDTLSKRAKGIRTRVRRALG